MVDNSWKLTKLDEVAICRNGAGIKQEFFTNMGIPLVRVSDFTDNSINLHNCIYLDTKHAHRWKDYSLVAGDILVATVGSWPPNWSSVVGKVVQVPPDVAGAIQNQNTACILAKHGIVDQRFLYYLLKSQEFIFYAANSAHGSANQARLSVTNLERFTFKLPPISEQIAIAHILGTFDDKIELNSQMNMTIESMARAIFKSWFIDFDPVKAKAEGQRPEGMDDAIASLFPSSFTESNLGLIPEGWVLGKLGDIADNPRTGVQPTEISSDVPYIGLEHMPRHSISLYEWEGAGKVTSTKSAMQAGDFLFGKLRPYFHKVGISPINGITSTDILIVRPKLECFYSYLLMLISSVPFVEYTNKTSQGTKMPRTSWRDMSRYESIFPDKQVFIAYDTLVRPLFHRITANIHENKTLVDIRDNLLPKLLSGKLGVDEITEAVEAVAS